jgi:hypothetical protein
METLMTPRACTHCGQSFDPRPQVPNQTYCSSPECQRARKVRWQQDKLRTDPDYRGNQRDAQRAWRDRNPDYYRSYRSANSGIEDATGTPEGARKRDGLAKMDVSTLPAGLYRLRQVSTDFPVGIGEWLVKIIPVCPDCPCKKDVCKEMT